MKTLLLKRINYIFIIPILFLMLIYLSLSFYNGTFNINLFKEDSKQAPAVIAPIVLIIYNIIVVCNWNDLP